MRVFCAALIVASLAGAAYAQDDHVQRYGEKAKEKSPIEIEADKAATRAYENSLKRIPDQGPVDPWGNARSADAPKAVTKAAQVKPKSKPPTKTGSNAN